MAIPGDLVKDNVDQGTDDPKQARPDFADNVDKVNQLLGHMRGAVIMDKALGIGLGLEEDTGPNALRIKLATANGAFSRDSLGAYVNLLQATAEAGIDIFADEMLFRDGSQAAEPKTRRMQVRNFFKGLAQYSLLAEADQADDDLLPLWDLSALDMKTIRRDSIRGGLLGAAMEEFTGLGSTSATIPTDNTIPQITEGSEILSLTYTPKRADSHLYLHYHDWGRASSTGVTNGRTVALFRDAGPDALAAHYHGLGYSGEMSAAVLQKRVATASVAQTTFSVRYGSRTAGNSTKIAAVNTSAAYGAVAKACLTLFEVLE